MGQTTAVAAKATTSTLRLAERLLSTLPHAADTKKAADLTRIVRADPTRVTLATVEEASGLLRVSPAYFFKEHA